MSSCHKRRQFRNFIGCVFFGHGSMNKYIASCGIMHRNAAVLTVMCILLCLTFNYTFPLHREGTKWFMDSISNNTRICPRSKHEHHDNIADRTKNIAANIKNTFKRFKDSTDDFPSNTQDSNTAKNSLSEEDLRQYEQLVIMKKYPYLDLKEIEFKYSPSDKKVRQSAKYNSGSNYIGDPSICEPLEEMPNVEITNRGLTGFAIPAKIVKTTKLLESKLKPNNAKYSEDIGVFNQNSKLLMTSATNVLGSLRDDIEYYEGKKTK